jgi:hypothetical protein
VLASLRWMALLPLGIDGREVFPVRTVARMVIFSHAMVNKGTTTGAQSSILRSPAAKDSPPSPERIGLMSIKWVHHPQNNGLWWGACSFAVAAPAPSPIRTAPIELCRVSVSLSQMRSSACPTARTVECRQTTRQLPGDTLGRGHSPRPVHDHRYPRQAEDTTQ